MARGVTSSTIPASTGNAQVWGLTWAQRAPPQGAPFAPRGRVPSGRGTVPGFPGLGCGFVAGWYKWLYLVWVGRKNGFV